MDFLVDDVLFLEVYDTMDLPVGDVLFLEACGTMDLPVDYTERDQEYRSAVVVWLKFEVRDEECHNTV